ncbi:monoglyceride lipase-like [Saccoglossus kowalevskii]|uniref:Monoglyceride lipase-like n=1 Tax=Saccoglossus kowalevskii TaxID=10224 RepID=A0ABM0GYM6_SACKO|nr:PREDICTED: monoglyceride lipase-like [Saccoglossus kowalevskii]
MATSPQGVSYKDLSHFVNVDGLHIYARSWAPADQSKLRAVCLLLHGLAEHSGQYDRIAIPLTGCGVMVYAHDHLGHGQSEGDRIDIKDFNMYVRDSLQHVDIIKKKFPHLPIFLYGHSMGGTMVILAAMERPDQFAGVVASAPAIKLNEKLALIASTQHTLDLNMEDLSRDPEENEKSETDPLAQFEAIKPGFVSQLLDICLKIQPKISSIKCPFLALHGDADKVCDPQGSRMLMERAQSSDRKLVLYPGYYHDLHREPPQEAALVIRDITSWIGTRLPENPPKPDNCRQ